MKMKHEVTSSCQNNTDPALQGLNFVCLLFVRLRNIWNDLYKIPVDLESLPNPVQFIFHKSLEQRCVVQIGITCGATKSSNSVRTMKVKEELYFCSKIWEYSSVLRLSCPSICRCVVEILRWKKQQLQDQPVQNRAGMDGRYDMNKHEEEHGWMGVAAFRCSNGSRLKQVKQDVQEDIGWTISLCGLALRSADIIGMWLSSTWWTEWTLCSTSWKIKRVKQ